MKALTCQGNINMVVPWKHSHVRVILMYCCTMAALPCHGQTYCTWFYCSSNSLLNLSSAFHYSLILFTLLLDLNVNNISVRSELISVGRSLLVQITSSLCEVVQWFIMYECLDMNNKTKNVCTFTRDISFCSRIITSLKRASQ